MNAGTCRFCGSNLKQTFCDLGISPLSNAYLTKNQLEEKEPQYPLHACVCESCYLVQIPQFETPKNIFTQYAYFSSYSDSWVQHCRDSAEQIISRFSPQHDSLAIEIACNDGCFLKVFKEMGISVLGIEPAKNVAAVAQQSGIPCHVDFFSSQTARELCAKGQQADLLLGNNVLAHVPDLNDFVAGLKILLKPSGILIMEFPHLLKLIEGNQFDTIYHEHFSYFSFITAEKIFKHHGLKIFDVQKIPTHGGSLRIFARHSEYAGESISKNVAELRSAENIFGLAQTDIYKSFGPKAEEIKSNLIEFFRKVKQENKSIAGYGAPAKGNTLLNFCQIDASQMDYTVDRNPHKQNYYLPGSHIPIYHPDKIRSTRPDYLFILPWNIKDEVMTQMSYIREWGGKFIIPIPNIQIIP